MKTQEIIEANKLLAEFMGAKKTNGFSILNGKENHDWKLEFGNISINYKEFSQKNSLGHDPSILKFHSDWSWIMPVCVKWDNLEVSDFKPTSFYIIYVDLCDKLDNAVTTYKIIPIFQQMVENIKWFNSIKK